MKKVIAFILTLLTVSLLVGCEPANKEFSGIGITIELNDSFIKKDVVQAPFYLESQDHIFTGIRESKQDLLSINVTNTSEYINAVLNAHGKSATVEEYNEDDLQYYYAYYNSEVEDQEFGYMLFVLEGENHFYSFNFGCLAKNLNNNKAQYKEWIKTITVV